MSFFRIQDPEKRDEILREYKANREKLYNESLNTNISDANYQTDLSKFFKPLIESNENIKNELKSIAYREVENTPLALTYPESDEKTFVKTFGKIKVGNIAMKYLYTYLKVKNSADKVFGIHEKEPGKMFIGDKEIFIDNNDIIIDGEKYEGTTGLWELITRSVPDKTKLTEEDMKNYEKILVEMHAMEREGKPTVPKASRSEKWETIVSKIWEKNYTKTSGRKGRGVIILPSDPNVLTQRLNLSIAAGHAGNIASRNEAVAICDELLRQGEINKEEYRAIQKYIES